MTARSETTILHVDLDAFFASVEMLDFPELRGRPVIVGGLGLRGVVSTASYEARKYGVRSAMPMARARKACPNGVYRSPRMDRYVEKSQEVMAVLESVTPLVEPLSIDEAFLDVAGARRLYGEPVAIAQLIRTRVSEETGLTISIGAASTKFLAKLSSDLAKPDGLLVVPVGTELEFLAPLPTSRLWGVGPQTRKKLDRMGLRTVGDIAQLDESVLVNALGAAHGRHVHALANNDDPRPVVTGRAAKSIGAEETFATDLRTRGECERELVRLTDRACARLRPAGLAARTITLKIRFADFETKTRARTLAEATNVGPVILDTARELLSEFEFGRGVRLLGVSFSQLGEATAVQPTLDLTGDALDDPAGQRGRSDRHLAVERAMDEARDRFGARAVRPATLIDPDAQRQGRK
jgi:DNA polymerase-4